MNLLFLSFDYLIKWQFKNIQIDKRSTSTEGVIVGPYTPVYYLEYPRDNYLKVRRLVHVSKEINIIFFIIYK